MHSLQFCTPFKQKMHPQEITEQRNETDPYPIPNKCCKTLTHMMTPWLLTLIGTNHQTFLLSNNFCSVGANTLKFRVAILIHNWSMLLISHLCLKTVSPGLLALTNHSFPQIWVLSNNRECQQLSFSTKSSIKDNFARAAQNQAAASEIMKRGWV